MKYRPARLTDCPVLAEMNYQLIQDEGHRNVQTVAELAERMRNWLTTKYVAVLFMQGAETVGYAMYWEQPQDVYLRHFFVVRHRRRQGLGRGGMELLRTRIWPPGKRLTVEVLVRNTAAVAFWRAVGYQDYSLKMEIRPS